MKKERKEKPSWGGRMMEGVKWGFDDAVTGLVKQHSQVPLIHSLINQEQSKSETIRTSAKAEQTRFREEMFAEVPKTSWTCIHVLSFSSPQPPSFCLSEPISPVSRSAIKPRERNCVRWPTLSSSAEGLWVWARNRNSLYRHRVCWRRQ